MSQVVNLQMSFPEAMRFFKASLCNPEGFDMEKEREIYCAQLISSRSVIDLRKRSPQENLSFFKAYGLIDDKTKDESESIHHKKTLIFIDGPGCNGKSVLTKTLSEVLDDVEVIDLPGISPDGFYMNDFTSEDAWNAKDFTLEEKVRSAVEDRQHRTVILAGRFMERLYRAIALATLGKYFDQVISIFCIQKDIHSVSNLMAIRNAERKKKGYVVPDEDKEKDRISNEWIYSCSLMRLEDNTVLNEGCNISCLADSSILDVKPNCGLNSTISESNIDC